MAILDSTTAGDWTDSELHAAVAAYLQMLRFELNATPYKKAEVNRNLREGPLSCRTAASIEFRMQNISATLYDLKLPHIAGYLPARNVGSRVKKRIEVVLKRIGISDLSAYRPTPDREELDQKVAELRSRPLGKIPAGNVRPPCVSTVSSTYVRDPAVKRWVLELADGICEGCCEPAPFQSVDGYPYLEVHHVMPLALLGSDRVTNAVALCPNCHRRCHFSADRDEFKLSLYERVLRLRIEAPSVDEISQISDAIRD